jgi:endonuclease/exonuclease/phosphatase family metal-dependent hydrolase
MALLRPGEDDLIIAGDFNLEAVELATVTRAAAPSDGGGTTLDLLGNRTPRRTDHLLFRDARATAAVLGVATALDVRDVAPTPADYYRSVSDHLPIVIELRVADPDAR